MLRRNSLAGEERWARTPDVLVDDFLDYAREQFELVVEDLLGYPTSPPIVVEGPQLLPELTGGQAVFLVPTPVFQRGALQRRHPSRRPQIVERDLMLAQVIREQANELGRAVVEMDGTLDADALVARLEALFAPVVAARRPPADLTAIRRDENEAVFANLVAAGLSSYAFACECGRSGCTERVELSLEQFERLEHVRARAHAR